jgi:hypothetical protein
VTKTTVSEFVAILVGHLHPDMDEMEELGVAVCDSVGDKWFEVVEDNVLIGLLKSLKSKVLHVKLGEYKIQIFTAIMKAYSMDGYFSAFKEGQLFTL